MKHGAVPPRHSPIIAYAAGKGYGIHFAPMIVLLVARGFSLDSLNCILGQIIPASNLYQQSLDMPCVFTLCISTEDLPSA